MSYKQISEEVDICNFPYTLINNHMNIFFIKRNDNSHQKLSLSHTHINEGVDVQTSITTSDLTISTILSIKLKLAV